MAGRMKELVHLLERPTGESVFNYVRSQLDDRYLWYSNRDFYLFGVPRTGDILPACLVSHVDTVCKKPVQVISDGPLLMSADGPLGGDDRCGVFILLNIVRQMKDKLPYLLFTNYEEQGGTGVRDFLATCSIFWTLQEHINIFVEYDRRGASQVVYYATPDREVKDLAEQFGYHEEWGSYSDVADITRATGIAHANFSAGFQNEHTRYEIVSMHSVRFAIATALDMVPMLAQKKHYARAKVSYGYGYGTGGTRSKGKATTGGGGIAKTHSGYEDNMNDIPEPYDDGYVSVTSGGDINYSLAERCNWCGCWVDDYHTLDHGLIICDECDEIYGSICDGCLEEFGREQLHDWYGYKMCPKCLKGGGFISQ